MTASAPSSPTQKVVKAASSTWSSFSRAWKTRGGWRDIFGSLYFWLAAVLLVPTSHFWLRDRWWELPISILPNVLGFSLGGYAIFLAFGDEKFKAVLARKGRTPEEESNPSLLLKVSSIFLHFIFMQLIALMASIVAKALDFNPAFGATGTAVMKCLSPIGAAFGFFLFLYALMLAFASALSIFQLGTLLEIYLTDGFGTRPSPPAATAPEPGRGDK